MTPQILTAIGSTSGVIGFFSLLAYFYFNIQIKQISRAERSVRSIVEGDGLFNADQVLEILREFKDEANRLKALDALTNHSSESAQRVYDKIKGRIDVSQFASKPNGASESASLAAAIFFILLAILALLYSRYGTSEDSGQHHTSTVTQTVSPNNEKKVIAVGKKQETPVEHFEITSQSAMVTEGSTSYNTLIFRVVNAFNSNIKDVEIAIYPSFPYPRLDPRTFLMSTAKCSPISGDPSAWKTQCEYVGVGGVIGFALRTELNEALASGKIVIGNPDGTKRATFGG